MNNEKPLLVRTAAQFVDKDIVHQSIIETLLTFVPGAKTPPKMLTHFHRAWAGSRELFKVLREQRPR